MSRIGLHTASRHTAEASALNIFDIRFVANLHRQNDHKGLTALGGDGYYPCPVLESHVIWEFD